jgi:3-polyprenyl-4-hydroxybenzoate decarboxylase
MLQIIKPAMTEFYNYAMTVEELSTKIMAEKRNAINLIAVDFKNNN